MLFSGLGNGAREDTDHASEHAGADGERRHQDDDVAKGPDQKPALPRLLRHSHTDPGFEWIGFSGGLVAHEFDTHHESLLPDVADVRQLQERLQQA
jgi:hypothetical protein